MERVMPLMQMTAESKGLVRNVLRLAAPPILLFGAAWLAWNTLRVPTYVFGETSGPCLTYVNEWRVLGPFDWTEAPVPNQATSDSPAVGRQLDHSFLPGHGDSGGLDGHLPAWLGFRRAKLYHSDNGLVRLGQAFSTTAYRVAYAECDVESDRSRDVVLLLESDDGMQVWLNGRPVFRKTSIGPIAQFQDYEPVHLRQGRNRLRIKLAHTQQTDVWDPWDFAVALRTTDAARHETTDASIVPFLNRVLLQAGQPLSLDLRLFPGPAPIQLRLRKHGEDSATEVLLEAGRVQRVPPSGLASGVVWAEIRYGAERYGEPVLYGSADAILQNYELALPRLFKADPRHQANLGALLFRLRHLLAPEHRSENDRIWQKKVAGVIWDTEDILADIAAGRDPYRGKPGTHLRGFVSSIDGQLQYYLMHVPPAYTPGKPIPLVVRVPHTETLRPFLEIATLAGYTVLRQTDASADKFGFAYLWYNNRGNTEGQQIGWIDLFSAIQAMRRDYAIDDDRIYLYGDCSGGRDALALAAAYPHLFAAAGLVSPSVQYQRTTVAAEPRSFTDRFACHWLAGRTPLNLAANLGNIPIRVFHGDRDEHTPVSESRNLAAKARSLQLPIQVDILRGGTHLRFPVDIRNESFGFLKGKVRARPAHVTYSTSWESHPQAYWIRIDRFTDPGKPARVDARIRDDGAIDMQTENAGAVTVLSDLLPPFHGQLRIVANGKPATAAGPVRGELAVVLDGRTPAGAAHLKRPSLAGPLSDAFAGPFLVVVGTAGKPGEAAAAANQANRFRQSWKTRFFTECPWKADRDIGDEDLRLKNLILFGTPSSNLVLARIAEKSPVRLLRDGVEVGGRRYLGERFSVQAVFPNPLSGTHYVVLAGDPECKACPADAVQFTLKAWYDAVVWSWDSKGGLDLAAAGQFDSSWTVFQPAARCWLWPFTKHFYPVPEPRP